jgi:hypothetical protein
MSDDLDFQEELYQTELTSDSPSTQGHIGADVSSTQGQPDGEATR